MIPVRENSEVVIIFPDSWLYHALSNRKIVFQIQIALEIRELNSILVVYYKLTIIIKNGVGWLDPVILADFLCKSAFCGW